MQSMSSYIVNKSLEWRGVAGQGNCVSRQVGRRAISLGHMVAEPITRALETVGGAFCGIGALVTLGTKPELNKVSRQGLYSASRIVPTIFYRGLQCINPNAIAYRFEGWVSGPVDRATNELATKIYKRDPWFSTRVVLALKIPVMIIARVVDCAIGLVAATFSVLTAGNVQRLNTAAYSNLQIGSIFLETFVWLLATINPRSALVEP